MKSKSSIAPLLAAFYFFYFAMVGVYVIFMPKVLKDIGYSPVEIGIIYTSAPLMRFLLPFVFKRFISLNNRVFLVALLLITISTLLFFISIDNFWLLLTINLIFGGAMGVVLPFIEIIALEFIGKERYGKVRLWGSIGFSVVAFILGKILDGFEIALFFLIATALLTSLFGYLLSSFNTQITEPKAQTNKEFSLSKYWALWASIFLFQFSFGGFYNFFTIYETSNGMPLDIVSYLWIFGVVCEIVMLQFQGPLLAKYPLLTLINISIISAIFRWALLAIYPTNLAILLLTQATHALSFALYYTSTIAYIYQLYPQKKLAQQFLLGVGFGLGGALGAAVAGVIYKYSPSGLFLFESFIALLASIMLIIHKKRKESEA